MLGSEDDTTTEFLGCEVFSRKTCSGLRSDLFGSSNDGDVKGSR